MGRWFAFRLRTLFVVVAVAAVPLAWVTFPVHARIAWVKGGQSRATVRLLVGNPVRVTDDTAYTKGWGYGTTVAREIGDGSPYEVWSYPEGHTVYLVFFGSKRKQSKDDWTVIGTDSYDMRGSS